MCHPLYGPKENAGSRLVQNNEVESRKKKIPNIIVRNVMYTINLVGGVHPIFYHQFNPYFMLFILG